MNRDTDAPEGRAHVDPDTDDIGLIGKHRARARRTAPVPRPVAKFQPFHLDYPATNKHGTQPWDITAP